MKAQTAALEPQSDRPSQRVVERLRAAVAMIVEVQAALDQGDRLERKAWNSLERTRRRLGAWADTLYLPPDRRPERGR